MLENLLFVKKLGIESHNLNKIPISRINDFRISLDNIEMRNLLKNIQILDI